MFLLLLLRQILPTVLVINLRIDHPLNLVIVLRISLRMDHHGSQVIYRAILLPLR